MSDTFSIAGVEFRSRLILGSGKYPDLPTMRRCYDAAEVEMVTIAVRRIELGKPEGASFLDAIGPGIRLLPNTAACFTADEAIRTARLAREALGTEWVKLEVIGDQRTLFPDNAGLLEATRVLVAEGFVVLPYVNDDPVVAKRLVDLGAAAVMPLAAPIGSGLGVQNRANLMILREQITEVPLIVDAGVGTASDATIAMELGADAILMNTAVALARQPVAMAEAMKLATQAGRLAWLAGRMEKRLYASASSPMSGLIQ
jgi:thiazole synthase